VRTNKGALVLSVLAAVAISVLFFGNFSTSKNADEEIVHPHEEGVSFAEFEEDQIHLLVDKQDQQTANVLKSKWAKSKDDAEKSKVAHDAARFWSERSPELAAYYHYLASDIENNADELIFAGDQLYAQFRESGNMEIRNNLINFAILSYESALKLRPEDYSLKLRMGEAYLEGMVEPMKGVGFLREVVAKDPENLKALILLGRFSVISGQYERAKEHLDKALAISPTNTEAMYFMAFTQEGLGNKEKAIELFELLKEIINVPEFSEEMDLFIEQIQSN